MTIHFNEILEFAEDKINTSSRINRYPFRNRYNHTLRVLKWAERLQKIEGGDLEVIRIAAIFHDVGWSEHINHSIISKEIAEEYLTEIDYDTFKKQKVLEAVENHNFRNDESTLNLESYILMDADILDEVGAISILWDAMASAYEEEQSYKKTYERIKKYTTQIKERKHELKTTAGKQFYEERITFIDSFIKELEFELNI